MSEDRYLEGENLHRLCRNYGILSSYYNANGQLIETSPSLCKDLIQALGEATSASENLFPGSIAINENEPFFYLPFARQDEGLSNQLDRELKVQLELESGEGLDVAFTFSQMSDSRQAIRIDASLPMGYHTLILSAGQKIQKVLLITAPVECYVRPDFEQKKSVGISVQLYALRSGRNFGIGDFADLDRFIQKAAEKKLSVVGVNPLHALLPGNPHMISPYYPSSRQWLNWLYIAPDWTDDWRDCIASGQTLPSAPSRIKDRTIEYHRVIKIKQEIFRILYRSFQKNHYGRRSHRDLSFQRFLEEGGDSLHRQATFDALYNHLVSEVAGGGGSEGWPESFRHPDRPEVQKFAEENGEEVLFFKYLQWIAKEQLDLLGRRAMESGIALYLDIAVGAAPGGAEVWGNPESYSKRATIGAPPDHFAPLGQDWGIAPLIPDKLVEGGFEPFIQMVRSNMVRGGILRIDHIMALFRLYWVTGPGKGAYVQYPSRELLSILSLESWRNECMIIGEDLGTVPPEVRDQMRMRKIHTWKVFYFEREGSEFRDPAGYEAGSVTTVNTHDLPTLAGFWHGSDLTLKRSLNLIDDAVFHQLSEERILDRQSIKRILERSGLWPDSHTIETIPVMQLVEAVHLLLAKTNSRLYLLSIHDLMGDERQPNLPGTADEYPNWSIFYPVDLDQFEFSDLIDGIHKIRSAF